VRLILRNLNGCFRGGGQSTFAEVLVQDLNGNELKTFTDAKLSPEYGPLAKSDYTNKKQLQAKAATGVKGQGRKGTTYQKTPRFIAVSASNENSLFSNRQGLRFDIEGGNKLIIYAKKPINFNTSATTYDVAQAEVDMYGEDMPMERFRSRFRHGRSIG
jgi:hypothetical protein